MLSTEQAVFNFLSAVMIDVKRTAEDKDLVASGGTINSLAIEGNTLLGSENFYWLEHGRGPGNMPPVQAMEDWIKVRGFSNYNPWAVAKSIAQKGTRIWRNKSLGLSVGEIATKYEPMLLADLGEAVKLNVLDRLNEIILKGRNESVIIHKCVVVYLLHNGAG